MNNNSLLCLTCGLTRKYAMLDNMFDMLTVGVACIRTNGDLMFTNRLALNMLNNCGILIGAVDNQGIEGRISDWALKKLSLDLNHTTIIRRLGFELQIQVEPFHNAASDANGEDERRQGAMLILRELGKVNIPSMQQLKSLYGFTQAEARLAIALCSGKTIHDCAEHLSVKIATVRTQLRALMEKTGSHRQAELLTKLLSASSASVHAE